jgi:hypothetical protein
LLSVLEDNAGCRSFIVHDPLDGNTRADFSTMLPIARPQDTRAW